MDGAPDRTLAMKVDGRAFRMDTTRLRKALEKAPGCRSGRTEGNEMKGAGVKRWMGAAAVLWVVVWGAGCAELVALEIGGAVVRAAVEASTGGADAETRKERSERE